MPCLLFVCLVGWLVGWLVGSLVRWLLVWWVGWLIVCLLDCVCLLVRLFCLLVCLFVCLLVFVCSLVCLLIFRVVGFVCISLSVICIYGCAHALFILFEEFTSGFAGTISHLNKRYTNELPFFT